VLTIISFYLLATVAIASALMVVAARNPVHSVMFLITTFFSAAGLFILMGAEFLALLLVMVYVGAVAVLFLFVVMMLDVDFVEMKQGMLQYMPYGIFVAVILFLEMFLVGAAYFQENPVTVAERASGQTNLQAFAEVLYTDYAFYFEAAGFVLLVAMIGAIVLTLRERDGVHVDIKPGEGLVVKGQGS